MDTRSVDLARLIAIVAEEVMAASRRPAARCACHSVVEDCCPDAAAGRHRRRRRAARRARRPAARRPASPGSSITRCSSPTRREQDIEQLCQEAAEFRFATVCVNPAWVALCAARLRGTPVGVCSVVGFPLGATTADVKHFETRRVIFDGAREVDMVINIGALKSGDLRTVERDIEAVTGPCRDCRRRRAR